MRVLSHIVEPRDDGRALRSVLPARLHLGAHLYRRLKVMEAIFVNGENARADRILRAGDMLSVRIPDCLEAESMPAAEPVESDLSALPASRIVYQDEDLIIVSKGAPLASLPCSHLHTGTLTEQLAAMLGQSPESFQYHPVNRLDKGTSGLMAVARNAHAQRLLTAQLHTDAFIREYYAVTEGTPEENTGIINAPIARLGEGARRIVREDGKHAVTHYRVVRTDGSRSLLRLRLETGRTHQIRVHLAHIGCPICGDYLYGSELPGLQGRFALHSCFLRCVQPVSGKTISLEDPLSEALGNLLIP